MGDIHINFGQRPRRRRRRRALGAAGGLAALLVAALLAFAKKNPAPQPPRLPSASAALSGLRGFAPGLAQVPAVVVEQGPFRHVPYLSYQAGAVEVNVYGSPERPAGLEIGVYDDPSVHAAARDALAALLPNPGDVEILRSLDLAKASRERQGLRFEVTPASAPDAFGAWWVSVYAPAALDASRAEPDAGPRPSNAKTRRPGRRVYSPR